jgi:hypothetical protein
MELGELAKAVLSSGRFRSSSPVFAQNLGMALRQDPRFKKMGRGLYAAVPAGARPAPARASARGKKASRKTAGRKAGRRKAGGRKKRA